MLWRTGTGQCCAKCLEPSPQDGSRHGMIELRRLALRRTQAGCRKVHGDGRALACLAFQDDAAAMGFRQALDDGQSQSRALVGNGDVVLALAETVEDGLLVLGRDADAGVADSEENAAARDATGKD